jgi:nucleoside-diphosphate-sugar epimerase
MAGQLLIIGAGYLGQRIAHFATQQGATVWTARRSSVTEDVNQRIIPIKMDVNVSSSVRERLSELANKADLDAVVYCVSAGSGTESAYQLAYDVGVRNVIEHLPQSTPLIFVSSTGVYHQNDGKSVDENSLTDAARLSSTQRFLLSGESSVMARPNSWIARFSGIYGPGRTRLIAMARALQDPFIVRERAYTNRIHVDDGARAVLYLLSQKPEDKVFCITDSNPALQHEVMTWLRLVLGLPEITPRFQSDTGFHEGPEFLPASNKQISNQRLTSLGFKFCYPSYQDGYAVLI